MGNWEMGNWEWVMGQYGSVNDVYAPEIPLNPP